MFNECGSGTIVYALNGIKANKTGAIIPQTGKTGPMTGSEAIMSGIVAAAAGLAFWVFVLVRKIQQNKTDRG